MRIEYVRKEVGMEKLSESIERNILRWFGHVKRMGERGGIPNRRRRKGSGEKEQD